ncbi:carboxylesterase family protein [Thalassoroseus pseudoceratinae]|uniref:carboxylesterase family protein n=1 Tax=Thalassoroseus pseudoceratinae TaxID=2713176 RepID=UPI00141E8E13|nr:hypothetical protein [Thalassoroseus pseudoceratinae]
MIAVCAVVACCFSSHAANAGEVRLANGVILEGRWAYLPGLGRADLMRKSAFRPVVMVDDSLRRYLVPKGQVENIDDAAGVTINQEHFSLPQRTKTRVAKFGQIGSVRVLDDFDDFGRRTVEVQTGRGPMKVVQGITKITPTHVEVKALTELNWEHAIATTSLKEEKLSAMIEKVIDENKPTEMMAVAIFYMQAGMYQRANKMLDRIIEKFAEMRPTAEEVRRELNDVQAGQLLAELRMRRQAGQNELASYVLRQFPTELGASVQKEISDQQENLRQQYENLDFVQSRLATLQQQVSQSDQQAELETLRATLRRELDLEGLDRLQPFVNLQGDVTLSPEEKLALAYSGWLLGGADAMTDLPRTLRLWQARYLVLEALRTYEVNTETRLIEELNDLEGVGIDVVMKMIPHLPPLLDTPSIRPLEPHVIEARELDPDTPVRYRVLLPHEYSPNHSYPAIVALHPEGRGGDWSTMWWGGNAEKPGQSARHGYIVIAPEYVDADTTAYSANTKSLRRVLRSLQDASKRFSIDSDRVFLSGHGMGADAAFDIGLTRPDVFAGVIPISGRLRENCKWKWENAEFTSWYIISGELAEASLQDTHHSQILMNMMKRGTRYDVIVAEYLGRGYETFYEEIHQLFDWMDLQTRQPQPKDLSTELVHTNQARYYWLAAEGLPVSINKRPITVEADILDGSTDHTTINLSTAAKLYTVWLSTDLIAYDRKLLIRMGGRRKYNEFPHPTFKALFEDYRERADHRRLYHTKIVVE